MIDSERFTRAAQLSSRLHQNQNRKGSQVPYLSHLLAVCALVMRFGGDEDESIAALLHDAVEDQGGQETLACIEEQFGSRVADIVAGCSDTDQHPKPPWEKRKAAYIEHLRGASGSVLLVSAADKYHNAQDLLLTHSANGEAAWGVFNATKLQTQQNYRMLVEVFTLRSQEYPRIMPLVAALSRVVDQISQL